VLPHHLYSDFLSTETTMTFFPHTYHPQIIYIFDILENYFSAYTMPFFVLHILQCLFTRAVSVNTLIYAINLAAINALKYFKAINATLFTPGVR